MDSMALAMRRAPHFGSPLAFASSSRLQRLVHSSTAKHLRRCDRNRTSSFALQKQRRCVIIRHAAHAALPALPAVPLLAPMSRVGVAVGLNLAFLLSCLRVEGLARSLTPAGAAHAAALGTLIWSSMGAAGWLVLATFFVLGSLATRLGRAQKAKQGIEERRGGQRGPENVWGAAATGAICALVVLFAPLLSRGPKWTGVIALLGQLGFVSSMATKVADTVSSEVGKAYGRTTVLPLTGRVVPRGTEGAISVEGTLAGIAGAALLTFLAWKVRLIPYLDVPVCIVAAALANLAESIIGSTFQKKLRWTNEGVNVLNTAIGAVIAFGLRMTLVYFNIYF